MSKERLLAQVPVTFLSRSSQGARMTDWVSYRGVFVRTASPPPERSLVRLEFVLPPAWAKVEMHGVVTHVVAPLEPLSLPGVDIAFFAKGGDASRVWDQFIQHVREAHPEASEQPVWLAQRPAERMHAAPRRGVHCPPRFARPLAMSTLSGAGGPASRFPSGVPGASSWAALDAGWTLPPA